MESEPFMYDFPLSLVIFVFGVKGVQGNDLTLGRLQRKQSEFLSKLEHTKHLPQRGEVLQTTSEIISASPDDSTIGGIEGSFKMNQKRIDAEEEYRSRHGTTLYNPRCNHEHEMLPIRIHMIGFPYDT